MCKVFGLFMLSWSLVGNICNLKVRKYSILQYQAVERNIEISAGVEVSSVYEIHVGCIILCHVLLCKGIFTTLFLSLKPGELNCIRLYCIYCNKKRKAISLQAWTGPEGSRKRRLPDFKSVST